MNRFFSRTGLTYFVPSLLGVFIIWILLRTFQHKFEQIAFWDAVISVVIIHLLGWSFHNILSHYRPESNKIWMVGVWIIVFASISTFLSVALLKVKPFDETYLQFVDSSIGVRYFIQFLIYLCIALLTWVQKQLLDEKEIFHKIQQLNEIYRNAELQLLKQQWQPHFLFNSLNSVYQLTSSNPENAKKMILHLTEFLRGTLKTDPLKMHSLQAELSLAKEYIEIEKIRFPKIGVLWKIPANCEECLVPSLIFQPLIENAIKYGLNQNSGVLDLHISSELENMNLKIQIQNPFDTEIDVKQIGVGFGLDSIQKRLRLLYQQPNLLSISKNEHYFTVSFTIPQSL